MNAPVKPGEVLAGKYQVERVLGEGGMGVVVAARHLHLDQIVALKFLRPASAPRRDLLDRFAREARNAVRLRSEHVARIMDVGTLDGGSPYIVMEYLEGSDLARVLSEQGTLSIPVAVDYVLQACDAIAEAHALGIIHRDLKPENLFVTRGHDNTNLVKVLDFGISKSIAGNEFSATSSQAVIGSPAYMSPEQMRSAKLVDTRTDLWSLGVILYQLVVGQVPWNGDTLPMLCFRITSDPPPPFPDRQHAGFEAVVWRCLEKDPDRRFSSVHALAVALSPFAPPHALPLVERIGRVLQGRTDGPPAATVATTRSPETLREMSGERMRRTAAAPRTRRLIGVLATVGALAAVGITAIVLGVGRGGGAAEPATLPAAEHPVTPPVAASAPAPVVASPPPAPQPEPAIAPAVAAEPPPPVPAEPPPPGPPTRPRNKEHHRRPSSATASKPMPAAPPAATPAPADTPPPVRPPAARDPLASPD
ncbi:MAG TPA: serine/threonine-protein kinase [Kofleriaceae bacterium]|jgi:serine/threonine-protein kinase|nr:serine/threonine-protein kinase [Kofleriaceae bacterium]